MNFIQTLIMSAVEGITEFLPVSSTGHLTLTAQLLKINQTEFVKSFEIFIQLGSILAIVVLYFRSLSQNIKVWTLIIVAFIPTGVFGLILYKFIKHYLLGNSLVVVLMLFLGGLALIILEKIHQEKENNIADIEKMTLTQAAAIGLIQSVSMIPGVSRAAATIFGGMLMGVKRKTAVEFSFLLAVPTMLAATLLDLVKSQFGFTVSEWFLLGVGFAGAFLTAMITVKFFLKYITTHTFIPFGVYRIILSVLFWLVFLK